MWPTPTHFVAVFVDLSVGHPPKIAEPIEVLFEVRAVVDPKNHALDGGSHPPSPRGRGSFGGRCSLVLALV